ncbi:MAG: glycosyltransferase family 2 protein [Nitrospirae bacterium]|nr:glycosyltransferase family 2 protein [Nitrospirota bacterium]
MISILIANYKAADLLLDCLHSISMQNADTEVIIVDNNSGDYDREALLALRREFPFLKTVFNKENRGFSEANNQAYALSRGEHVLFLNPDTFLFPSCLNNLVSFSKTAGNAGGIIPRLWMDKGKTFLMPPSDLPSMWAKAISSLALSNDSLFTLYRKRWLRKALTFWNSDAPLTVDAISGAFFLTERKVLERVGEFDERFPLYFEDSDLCRRMKKAGLRLYYFPHADAVHLYNQSAKKSGEATQKFIASEKMYMEKFYSPYLISAVSWLERLAKPALEAPVKPWDFSVPITATPGDYLLFSSEKTMIPCVCHKILDNQFIFEPSFTAMLARGAYYAMVLKADGSGAEELIMDKH